MRKAKVYGIEFEGKIIYVGVTKQKYVCSRLVTHKSQAKKNLKGKTLLGEWMLTNKKFTVQILEECPVEVMFKREAYWIKHYNVIETGLNRPNKAGPGRQKGCDNPRGKDHYLSRKIRCMETGKIFDSMREAAQASGMSIASICNHANGKVAAKSFEFV
jgi:hypothetical protein